MKSPQRDRHRGDRDADEQRDARAIDGAGEHVAAEMVGAEPVRLGRRAQPLRRLHRDGVAGEQRRGDREQGDDR